MSWKCHDTLTNTGHKGLTAAPASRAGILLEEMAGDEDLEPVHEPFNAVFCYWEKHRTSLTGKSAHYCCMVTRIQTSDRIPSDNIWYLLISAVFPSVRTSAKAYFFENINLTEESWWIKFWFLPNPVSTHVTETGPVENWRSHSNDGMTKIMLGSVLIYFVSLAA